VRTLVLGCVLVLCSGAALLAADLKPAAIRAFDDYIGRVEARVDQRVKGPAFLWSDEAPARIARLKQGQILAESRTGTDPLKVPDGLVHDWIGAVFVRGVTVDKAVALAQDYNSHKQVYKPEVLDSRLVRRDGAHFTVFLRLQKKKVITVVLDSDHDVHYFQLDEMRYHSRSYSTRMAEVDHAGEPDEHTRPVGEGHGFLWRLYSYWRFEERDGGVYLECEAISLSRDIPTGLGWLIAPIIRQLPHDSLVNTLRETREALLARR
jgi:hypothetical protein